MPGSGAQSTFQPQWMADAQIGQLTYQPGPSTSQAAPTSSMYVSNLHHRRLLDLPTFSGEPEQWPQFEFSFTETTKVYGYTIWENHLRLQKSLTGVAREAVEGMLIHPRNIEAIMNTLRFRFGRPELLVGGQMTKIRKIRALTEEDSHGFISFATTIRNVATLFCTADLQPHITNPQLIKEIVARLPYSRRVEWAVFSTRLGRNPSLLDLDNWMDQTARVLCLLDDDVGTRRGRNNQHNFLVTEDQPTEGEDQSDSQDSKTPLPKKENQQRSLERRFGEPSKHPADKTTTGGDGRQAPECAKCKSGSHKLPECEAFKKLSTDERWNVVKQYRLCLSCLETGHQIKGCPNRRERCPIAGCQYFHHPTLHHLQQRDATKTENKSSMVGLGVDHKSNKIIYRVLPVRLIGPKKTMIVHALLDEGSFTTLMDLELATELGLQGPDKVFDVKWFNDSTTKEMSKLVSCDIQGLHNSTVTMLRGVRAVRTLNLPTQTLSLDELRVSYPALKECPLDSYDDVRPRLLIGLNNVTLTTSVANIICAPDGPVASKTALGWVLYGPTDNNDENMNPGHNLMLRDVCD